MAKIPDKEPKKAPAKAKSASDGVISRLKEKKVVDPFKPSTVERAVSKYVKRRSSEMIEFRRGLDLERRWKQADAEYVPHELAQGSSRKRFETDQDTGLRSRMVPVGDSSQAWRETSSAPTLLSKIQTAVSIIVDNQPEADLVALVKKYEDTTALAYALWKRNWSITDAKEKLKLVIFNLIKYGWAPQRTFPRKIEYAKRVKVEVDPTNPENDKYEEKMVTWFNDVDREPLNPFTTWIDEMTRPYDPYSMNECYFEKDYIYDNFMVEFGMYPNSAFVPEDSAMVRRDEEGGEIAQENPSRSMHGVNQAQVRKDIVTVGFFESRSKDLYTLYIPRHNIVLYHSPMPNDDGYLSLTQTLWILRNSNLPYGISLWEVIRQNKGLYDKMKNMTMDQLVLSIMKFGFFAGTSTALGDGKIDIIPGQARQLTSSTGKPEVSWMDIPGPGQEAWRGLEAVATMMDNESGISQFLEGGNTPGPQTLGELLHMKEANLKRLKVPVDNIAWLVDQDAYLTLSWMSQLYSIPTIKTFADEKELMDYEKEEQITHTALFQGQHPETGALTGPIEGHFLPQLALHLEDREGKLIAGKESKFFQVGKDIMPNQLKWKGIFKTIPRSIIDSSQELLKASKTEMFNIIMPMMQFPPEMVAKAVQQIVKVNEEDPKDWLPDSFIKYLEDGTLPPPPPPKPGEEQAPANPMVSGGTNGQTMQADAGMGQQSAQTVVPQGQVSPPTMSPGGGQPRGVFNRKP